MRHLRVAGVLALALGLSGCVIPSVERAKLIKSMQDKCAKEGKVFVLDDSKSSGIPNITPYEMQMSGRCMPKDQAPPPPPQTST